MFLRSCYLAVRPDLFLILLLPNALYKERKNLVGLQPASNQLSSLNRSPQGNSEPDGII